MIWVHQFDLITLGHVCESCPVAGDTLIGEVLEYLLKRSLRDTVLFNAKVSLFTLETTK